MISLPQCAAARLSLFDGGFATHAVAAATFVFPLPEGEDPVHLASSMCTGLIGRRALKTAGDAEPWPPRRLRLPMLATAAIAQTIGEEDMPPH